MRSKFLIRIVAVLAGAVAPAIAATQHEHQTGTTMAQPNQAVIAECAQAQPQAIQTIDGANVRLEAARQGNSPAAMRAAVDDLQSALRQLRAQLAPCAGLQGAAGADPHAGHVMPNVQRPPSAAPGTPAMQPGSPTPAPAAPATATPAAADPHAGHTKPKPQPSGSPVPRGTAGTRPEPTKPAPAPATADPHAGHAPAKAAASRSKAATKPDSAKPAPAAERPAEPTRDPHAGHGTAERTAQQAKEGKVMDPVTGLMVDPASAPKTTYQGQTYYFSSEESRKEFLQNPAKFAKKPKQ